LPDPASLETSGVGRRLRFADPSVTDQEVAVMAAGDRPAKKAAAARKSAAKKAAAVKKAARKATAAATDSAREAVDTVQESARKVSETAADSAREAAETTTRTVRRATATVQATRAARAGLVEDARRIADDADLDEGVATKAIDEAEAQHYDVVVNKRSLSVGALTTTLNERWENGWQLAHVFEQRGNTVLVFEKRS
jgi:hypothetical protein